MKIIRMNKRQAKALLAALDWCEYDFKLGKSQVSIREKIYEKFPDLKPNLEKEATIAIIANTLAYALRVKAVKELLEKKAKTQ